MTVNITATAIVVAAPANSNLAPVLNKGTLDLSASRLSARTLKMIQIRPRIAPRIANDNTQLDDVLNVDREGVGEPANKIAIVNIIVTTAPTTAATITATIP